MPQIHHLLLPLLPLLLLISAAAASTTGPTAFATITNRRTKIPAPSTTGTAATKIPIPTRTYAAAPTPRTFATVSSRAGGANADGSADGDGNSINPFGAKAALIRYWSRKIPNGRPKPAFLLSKASPLSAADTALYERLAARTADLLAPRLRVFCSAAALVCFPELAPTLDRTGGGDAAFSVYSDRDFSNYGTRRAAGLDSFTNYSSGENVPIDSFRRYSRDSTGHADRFANYELGGNVVTANFTSYATGAAGGSGDFSTYHKNGNVPNLKFTNYDSDANGRVQTFSSYADDTNAGDQSFASYGKRGLGIPLTFTSYGKDSNVVGSTFSKYGESATSAIDTFTSYASNGNVPQNNFRSYGDGGHAASETFTSYRDKSNVGDDTFTSYAKGSTGGATATFSGYGQTFNTGSDTFSGYGEGAKGSNAAVGFTTYGVNSTFKDYADKRSASFKRYNVSIGGGGATESAESGGKGSGAARNRWVEPGRFFRESSLRTGTVMPMVDIRDRMPRRAFLPRAIAAQLPFSKAQLAEMDRVFNATADTALSKAMTDTVSECERAPSRGESKRCATSVEDMIDFAVSVLGSDIVVRSAENTAGSKGDVLIGEVRGINGGRVTKSVSCHQSLFPYMVYYCHSVPKVRVYEADILDVRSRGKINHLVAVCHLDTSDWSPGHGAFVALGAVPGKIEVCHWIFEGDMNWAVAD